MLHSQRFYHRISKSTNKNHLPNDDNRNHTRTLIRQAPMGVLAPKSAHTRSSARPPSTLVEIFRHMCLQSRLQTSSPTPQKGGANFFETFLMNFLSKSGNSKHFSFFWRRKKLGRGGRHIFKKTFSDQFSWQILNNFFSSSFFSKKNQNCGHYVCPAPSIIVVTMFTCHLAESSGICLHLAWTNMS